MFFRSCFQLYSEDFTSVNPLGQIPALLIDGQTLTQSVRRHLNHLFCDLLITASKRSCGKVMFLHLSVILFTEGRVVSVKGGLCQGVISVHGGLCPGGSLTRGGICLGVSVQRPHTVKSGWYKSYWHAFLLHLRFFSFSPFLCLSALIFMSQQATRTWFFPNIFT